MCLRFGSMAGLGLVLLMTGCLGTPTEVGGSRIPVFPESRLESSEEFQSLMGESLGRMESYTSTTWNFRTRAPADEVADWYKAELPGAELEELNQGEYEGWTAEQLADEEIVLYTFYGIPGNASPDDDFTVEIGEGWYCICETLKD